MKSVPHGRFVVLDFETTGLSPGGGARVIEVSAREVVDGRAGEEFLTFVDPGQEVPFEITQITGITTEMFQGAPKSPMVMRELAAFIGSSPVVGHSHPSPPRSPRSHPDFPCPVSEPLPGPPLE